MQGSHRPRQQRIAQQKAEVENFPELTHGPAVWWVMEQQYEAERQRQIERQRQAQQFLPRSWMNGRA